MKKTVLTIVAGMVALALVGCALFNTPEKSKATIKELASYGTTKVLRASPDLRPNFVAAADSLTILINNNQLTPEDVNRVFNDLNAKNPLGIEDFRLALYAYNNFFLDAINENVNNTIIGQVLSQGLRDGILAGLPPVTSQ